jgi:hypothetical protein
MDGDNEDTFERTVEWAVAEGIETATFHILTPYPGTALYARLGAEGRITTRDWDLYDTRHAVFRPARMTATALERGYWRAYEEFYSWRSILKGAWTKAGWGARTRHLAYAGGWKKCEGLWDLVIRARRLPHMLPLLEKVLAGFGRQDASDEAAANKTPREEASAGLGAEESVAGRATAAPQLLGQNKSPTAAYNS